MNTEFPQELITGIEKIDLQHMELMARLDELYESYIEGKNIEKTLEIMKYLKCYVNEHFVTEEKYMRDFKYHNIKRHSKTHREFVNDFCQLEKDLNAKGYTVDFNLDFNIKIIEWVKNHVMMEDKLLADFIKNCKNKSTEQVKV